MKSDTTLTSGSQVFLTLICHFTKILPADLLDGLGIEKIDPDEVVMRPSLLVELGLR